MIADISKVQFESKGDIVDYVTRGILPPSEKDFSMLIDAITHYGDDNHIMEEDKQVHLSDELFPKLDEIPIFVYLLRRAYENRKRNRNAGIVGASIIGVWLVSRLFKK